MNPVDWLIVALVIGMAAMILIPKLVQYLKKHRRGPDNKS